MKTRSIETVESRSVPAFRVITLPERDLAHREQTPGGEACAQTCVWARTSNYLWTMGVVAVGLGLHFYYVREMLASLALFSLFFFSLTLVVLSVFFVCYAGNQAGLWAGPASRAIMALFQRQDHGGAELARVPIVEEQRPLSDQRIEAQTQFE
jgi:hypothetical protein